MTKLLKKGAAQGGLAPSPEIKGKSVGIAFTGHDITSDGGLLLLSRAEQQAASSAHC